MPGAADGNPRLGKGGANFANVTCWMVNQIFFEGKMRTIFSMLFGAGVIILTGRAEKRGAQAEIADIYYRRTLWLIVFGLLHAYFLWEGDILFFYGAVGLLLFPIRRLKAPMLIGAGLLLLAVAVPKAFLAAQEADELRRKAEAAQTAAGAGEKLTKEQADAKRSWTDRERGEPEPEEIEREIADHRSGYWTLFPRRMRAVIQDESKGFYQYDFYDVAGMMLIGMGLMKLGVFSAERSMRFYKLLAMLGYGIGLPITTVVGVVAVRADFHQVDSSLLVQNAYHPGRLAVALGHIGLVMLLYKAGRFAWLMRRLAAVGQTALSNYFLDSIVCCLLFNGYGLGWFGSLERYQLLGVVFSIWTVQLLISPIWLHFFRFGPMEWLWRSLTYLKPQPFLQG
jgi:uncharacterized protein